MPETSAAPETNQTEAQPRLQCRHIRVSGHRCGSPCLRGEDFCYHHHTTRRPIPPAELQERKGRRATFDLPLLEDRGAIQAAIGQILRRIANHGIDPRRAGLLLYGLQIASLNLPKAAQSPEEVPEQVEEVVHHELHGDIAPVAELVESKYQPSFFETILHELDNPDRESHALDDEEAPLPTTLDAINGSALIPSPAAASLAPIALTPPPTPISLEACAAPSRRNPASVVHILRKPRAKASAPRDRNPRVTQSEAPRAHSPQWAFSCLSRPGPRNPRHPCPPFQTTSLSSLKTSPRSPRPRRSPRQRRPRPRSPNA